MIELRVADYCHNCPDFDEDVFKSNETIGYGYNPKTMEAEKYVRFTTIIRCKYRHRCENIMKHLKKEKT